MTTMMFKKGALSFCFVLISCLCSACSMPHCPPHDYQVENRVEATCTQDGSVTYKCDKCGDEYTETIEATGHTPGPEATTTSPQVCLVCGAVLHEKLTEAPVIVADALAINYFAGASTSFCKTPIDTQVHSKYTLPTQRYYDADPTSQVAKPLDLDISIPIQEFYTHDIYSVYRLATEDGKTFTTPNGFKVKFDIETIETKAVSELFAAANGDFLDNFETPDALKIVRMYQSSAQFGGIYEVVDFSNSYIEIQRDEDSANAKRISLWDNGRETFRTELEITDENGSLFYGEGTYRILFKYSMAWVTNPTSAVYDANGNVCYPYGLINDQYDYFYVTITDEQDGILVPEDFGEQEELFYQLRADTVIENGGELFLPSGGTICFKDGIKLYADHILEVVSGEYYFNGKRLDKFSFELYRYDFDSDSGLDGTDPYVLYQEINLLDLLDGTNLFEISLNKDPQLRERPCRMVVTSDFVDESTGQVITTQQSYIFTFDWE